MFEINIEFCLKVALILVVFCLCFVFRRKNGKTTDESESGQDER